MIRLVDDGLEYPSLPLSVYVAGPPTDTWGFARWLGRAGCYQTDKIKTADVVFFAGGSDVNPKLYNNAPLPETAYDDNRDRLDLLTFAVCREEGIPMVGICRGAQFLWTQLGGRLYQDVDNHNDGEHEIMHFATGKKYLASSVHHQMCYPSPVDGLRLLATSDVSRTRKTPECTSTGKSTDYELWSVEKKGILGIQGHPEYVGWPQYSKLCADLIKQHILDSQFTAYQNGSLRLIDKF